MYLAFALPTVAMLLFTGHLTSGEIGVRQYAGFLLGGLVLMVGGWVDDKMDLRARYAFIAPLIAVLIMLFTGINVAKVTNPLGGAIELTAATSAVFAFVWLLGMTYTTKLLDGMDGLAGGVTAVGASMIAALALTKEYFQPDVALLAMVFLAAILGFLLWNWNPAQVFMGEGGSTFLGFSLGVLAIISGSKVATALLVMGIPAIDVAIVMARRLFQHHGIAHADRSHFHHLLLRLNISERRAVTLYCAVAFAFGVTTLIFSSWQKIAALGVLAMAVMLGVRYLLKKAPKL
jgi:UDP-GlcNAc:undecaprenyl-phosphate GlcNAc-1-phosphate transferase